MPIIYCPHCGETNRAGLVYCPECGHSWPHGGGVTYCQHPPKHDGDRHLECAGCSYQADKEGVIAPDGTLIPYPPIGDCSNPCREQKEQRMKRPKPLKKGDYCHEQHELIMRLYMHLRDLVNAVAANDLEMVVFSGAVSGSILEDAKAYNTDYRAWLESKRSGE